MYPNLGYSISGCTFDVVSRVLHSPLYVNLRILLTEARTAAELTQAEVAERMQRPQSFVSKYESGERRLDVIDFIAVCGALNVSAPDVLKQITSVRLSARHLRS